MRCPTLNDLPPPPPEKSGWPWTVETPQLPDTMPDGKPWPKISIVTPSYNQGQFIEETIRSILLQGYPNLEYIIMDGGSTDESVQVIKKYEPWLACWVSERDNGQANALNKGIDRCTGEVFNWINSDDYLELLALRNIAENIGESNALAGVVLNFGEKNNEHVRSANLTVKSFLLAGEPAVYQQPGTWIKLDELKKCGKLNEGLHYCFDLEMMFLFLNSYPKVYYSNAVLARFRLHPQSKTVDCAEHFEYDKYLIVTSLLLNSEFRNRYAVEIYSFLSNRYRLAKIGLIRNEPITNTKKIIKMLRAMVDDITSYPFRLVLGGIRRIIL